MLTALNRGPEIKLHVRGALNNGVTVDERITAGADENLKLLLDPKSGVDVAFSGTQKCLNCPPGLAPFTVSRRATERLPSGVIAGR